MSEYGANDVSRERETIANLKARQREPIGGTVWATDRKRSTAVLLEGPSIIPAADKLEVATYSGRNEGLTAYKAMCRIATRDPRIQFVRLLQITDARFVVEWGIGEKTTPKRKKPELSPYQTALNPIVTRQALLNHNPHLFAKPTRHLRIKEFKHLGGLFAGGAMQFYHAQKTKWSWCRLVREGDIYKVEMGNV
jgi:hypothetical protein